VSKSTHDPILAILRTYERIPDYTEKKAVLLTPQGGYFLYGNRFCCIADYELEFQNSSCQLQGKSVERALFFGQLQGLFHAVGAGTGHFEMLSLIFHVDLGEDEPLRGILLAIGQDVQFVLSCDAAVEDLYRLAYKSRAIANPAPKVPPDKSLQRYAEKLRRNDLHGLTGLYLQSRPVKSIFEEYS